MTSCGNTNVVHNTIDPLKERFVCLLWQNQIAAHNFDDRNSETCAVMDVVTSPYVIRDRSFRVAACKFLPCYAMD